MCDSIKLPAVTKFPPMPVCKSPRVEGEYDEFVRDQMKEICRTLGIPVVLFNKQEKQKVVDDG